MDKLDLSPGDVVWVDFDPTQGKEQAGRRPAVVVSSGDYLDVVDDLVIVLPVTSVDRGWENHIAIGTEALGKPSYAMTEQIRTIARARIKKQAGHVSPKALADIAEWLGYFLVD